MKRITLWVAMFCITGLVCGGAVALAETCCQKAITAGKACEHPCCVEAAKDGKVCEKCNEKLKDCCKEAIKAGKVCEKFNPPAKEDKD